MSVPANDNERIRQTAPRLLAALVDMEQRFGHVGGEQIDEARLAVLDALGRRSPGGVRPTPEHTRIDFNRMALVDRMKAWPAAGGEDGLSSIYVGQLMDEAAREIARLNAQIKHYAGMQS